MRVTQNLNQTQFLSAIATLESNLSQTQNQISSNKAFTTASQNPTAAGAVNNYTQSLAQSQQYDTNANSAQTRLSTEDSTLSQVQTQLQSLRDLALQANRIAGDADPKQPDCACQYSRRKRRISVRRIRDSNSALHLERGRSHV
jgi:flagellar hook-associated protein 3 FlgL